MNKTANIELKQDTLILTGDWSAKSVRAIQKQLLSQLVLPTHPLILDGSKIETLDSSGALVIDNLAQYLTAHKIKISLQGFSAKQQDLIDLVHKNQSDVVATNPAEKLNRIAKFGKFGYSKYLNFFIWMTFVGEFSVATGKLFVNPLRIRWAYLATVIQNMGVRALPIIGFLSFLIGVVLTYQIGLELKLYGANTYIIGLLGLAIFREFGPLITAIILAGRTTSSYTAQLGLMKANEEIDALKTMGLSPTELLAFPRVIGLVLITPLLIMWSDIFGILGGMIMSKSVLGISYYSFIHEFPQNVTLTSFAIGMFKAPVFALILALVGCFHGFRVSGSSESIGTETTRSVVMAIFLIIIADAFFSIVLSWLNI